jgi:hypothetical protein
MNTKILGLLAVTVIAVPIAASAQETTLDYQGYVMGGTSTIVGVPFDPSEGVIGVASPPISTIATLDATVTYSGSVAQNNLVVDSYEINLTANNGASFELQNIGDGFGGPFISNGTSACGSDSAFVFGCINLTTSGDSVTGATINLGFPINHATDFNLSIGPNGDAFSASVYGEGAYQCGPTESPSYTYVGPASATPCTMNVSNPTAGVWTQAPEIDAMSTASGLTLFLGSILVLRGRRGVSTPPVPSKTKARIARYQRQSSMQESKQGGERDAH